MEQLTWKNLKIEWKFVLGYGFVKTVKQVYMDKQKTSIFPSLKLRFKFKKLFINVIL